MKFKSEIEAAIKQAVSKLYGLDLDPSVEHPKDERFGDYATSVALSIGQQTDADPVEIAHQLAQTIANYQLPIIKSAEVAEPGFINFWLKEEMLIKEVSLINGVKPRRSDKTSEVGVPAGASGDRYGSSEVGKGRTVVLDYSAPNVAKRFGIGHLRSTVIGQALYNLGKFHGFKVIGDNHLGDWGTQFGALLAQIRKSKSKIRDLTVDKLEELYVEFHKKADQDPKLMDEAREWFLKLESGDKEAREIWQAVVEVSKKEFDRIYALLGIRFDYSYGESFYEDKMPAVIAEVRSKGLSRKSDGAEIVEFENLPPAILVKSDGTTTYFTRDLATIKFRLEKWKPQFITYEVGADQKLHFQQVFEAAKKLGWGEGCHFFHVAHGLIRLPAQAGLPAGKMSTRLGQTIKLEDVLEEAIARAKKLTGGDDEISRSVGVGAIKYFDLSHQPQTDIMFDWEKLFLLEGNSAPYLQYTYARARSVLEKARSGGSVVRWSGGSVTKQLNNQTTEQPLLRWLYRFPESLDTAAENYSPNLVCNYLFELAQRFNSFYAKAPILKAEKDQRELRLALTAATAQVIKNGLSILGIDAPEKL
ncbi:arginine--tRNA ligase [candidate division WWE3 bacterium RIFCSPHIGHO2_01_FULL_48_15]|uniref:Arginine--tRNA ligase n=1 Tax=candidate division WWE3 bacterium RIFCSPHIGHO2_01_FULL_48_15 TaxID=1802619 RepID=A0A1F4VDS8_UNCKA|nr:MAG: arginine--tRNA ligase [candidate division WWE3 bacterium RIFCSPHIGHO2_01_FULL_48_15]